jgi:protein-tyrosine phosphatase
LDDEHRIRVLQPAYRADAATPHLRSDFPDVHASELADRCQGVRGAVEREQIPIALVSGTEVSVVWAADATDEQLTLASYGQRGTDLLIERPTTRLVGLDRFIDQLRTKGYRVTLGHPERSLDFQRNHTSLRELVSQGVLLQVNADSLVGVGGGRIRRLARHLVSEGLGHAIPSDGQRGTAWRPVTRLADAVEAAREVVGPERAPPAGALGVGGAAWHGSRSFLGG